LVLGAKTERITATTSDELTALGTHNMKLVIGLGSIGKATYPTLTKTFDFIVNAATCDCTLLTWDMPAA
jgi:hypothetical protein